MRIENLNEKKLPIFFHHGVWFRGLDKCSILKEDDEKEKEKKGKRKKEDEQKGGRRRRRSLLCQSVKTSSSLPFMVDVYLWCPNSSLDTQITTAQLKKVLSRVSRKGLSISIFPLNLRLQLGEFNTQFIQRIRYCDYQKNGNTAAALFWQKKGQLCCLYSKQSSSFLCTYNKSSRKCQICTGFMWMAMISCSLLIAHLSDLMVIQGKKKE